jgi:hypothetical protein
MTAKVAETEPEADRLLVLGRPDYDRCDNKVVSARYTFYNFLPVVSSRLLPPLLVPFFCYGKIWIVRGLLFVISSLVA